MTLDKATVLAQLRAEDVAAHLGITGRWAGRWMRSTRCGEADHGAEAFGISRDGKWNCHACDKGGDLLKLLAVAEKLDMRSDFPAIVALAASIAGVDDDEGFGMAAKPAPKPREPLPPVVPLAERIAIASRRASWAWGRLHTYEEALSVRPDGSVRSLSDMYLRDRGVDPAAVRAHEEFRETPLRCTMAEVCAKPELKSLSYLFAAPGIAFPVREVMTGALVDIRVRRLEPRPDQPKIIGMLGGVTSGPAEAGRTRRLVGCYGKPHLIDSDLVVVGEGLMDYATGLCVWPNACVLGAVSAGELGLVAAHAARQLASRGSGRMIIVEQNDPPGVHRDGRARLGAADAAINEDPNAAAKVAARVLGPDRVGWLFCGGRTWVDPADGKTKPTKDLNDLVRAGVAPQELVRWT